MKLIPSLGEISSKTKDAFKRFPITISWAIIGTLFCIYTADAENFDTPFYGRIILTFVLGISWLIATRFFIAQFKKDKSWFFIITLGFLLLFYCSVSIEGKGISSISTTRFVLYFITGHLLVLVAPFLLKWNKSAYFNYLKAISTAIARSFLFSLILYLGVVLALLAVKYLFDVDFDGKRFFQMFIICLGIVNTWIYLADFPKDIHNEVVINYTKALEVLVKYILIPLVILYLIILYAYSLKILINWNLPKGWVSYLIVALSLLAFSIQILVNPIQKTIKSRAINQFHPWFYYLLLPLIVLLFIAIFRRINEYGITENRYFVFTLALWILGVTLYMLFSKTKKIRVFPLSLAVLCLFISFGFWGAFSIATKSQVRQFEKVFSEIKNTDFNTTFQKKNQLQSIVNYLNNKQELNKITSVLGYNPKTAFKTDNKWQLQKRLMDSLNITVNDKQKNKYLNYHYSGDDFRTLINVKGYDFLKNLYLSTNNNKEENTINEYRFSLQKEAAILTISKQGELVGTIDCTTLIQKLQQQGKSYNIDRSYMMLEEELSSLKVKILFKNIYVSNPEKNKKAYILSASAYVLIKEKDAK